MNFGNSSWRRKTFNNFLGLLGFAVEYSPCGKRAQRAALGVRASLRARRRAGQLAPFLRKRYNSATGLMPFPNSFFLWLEKKCTTQIARGRFLIFSLHIYGSPV